MGRKRKAGAKICQRRSSTSCRERPCRQTHDMRSIEARPGVCPRHARPPRVDAGDDRDELRVQVRAEAALLRLQAIHGVALRAQVRREPGQARVQGCQAVVVLLVLGVAPSSASKSRTLANIEATLANTRMRQSWSNRPSSRRLCVRDGRKTKNNQLWPAAARHGSIWVRFRPNLAKIGTASTEIDHCWTEFDRVGTEFDDVRPTFAQNR